MRTLNANIITALTGGASVFNPSDIKDADGNLLLSQQLLVKQSPTITGVITDESKNKGDARPEQVGRAYTGDGVDDRLQLPFDLVASDVITNDGAGTLTPDYANNRIAISGQVWNIEIKDSSDVVKALYKCDEGAGDAGTNVTAIDSSGNGQDATITNATLSTFHSTQDVYSWHNEVGYTLGTGSNGYASGVFIPRDESNTAFDVAGNALQFTGRVPYNAQAEQSNCIELNGATQNGIIEASGDFNIEDNLSIFLRAKATNVNLTGNNYLFGKYDSGFDERAWAILLTPNETVALNLGNAAGAFSGRVESTSAIAVEQWHSYAMTFSGGTVKLYVDGLPVSTSSTGTIPTSLNLANTDVSVGSVLSSGNIAGTTSFGGQLANIRVFNTVILSDSDVLALHNGTEPSSGHSTLNLPISEGTGSVSHDVTEHGNDCNWLNAPTWAKQDNYPYNLVNGCSKHLWFNSTTANVNFNKSLLPETGDFFIEMKLMVPTTLTSTSGNTYIVDHFLAGPVGRGGLYINDGNIGYGNFGGTSMNISGQKINDGIVHTIKLTRVGNLFSLFVDDVLDVSGSTPNPIYQQNTSIGAGGSGRLMQGIIYWVNFNNEYFINGGTNELSSWYDSVGDAVVTSIGGSPSNIFIPAINSTTDALGQTPRNPAGAYHNGAETLIDFTNGVLSPEAVINNWEDDWAFNDARTNPKFKRTLTLDGVDRRADRFLAYRDTLSGDNLTKVNKYVETKEV